jgi:hypothetical protein
VGFLARLDEFSRELGAGLALGSRHWIGVAAGAPTTTISTEVIDGHSGRSFTGAEAPPTNLGLITPRPVEKAPQALYTFRQVNLLPRGELRP